MITQKFNGAFKQYFEPINELTIKKLFEWFVAYSPTNPFNARLYNDDSQKELKYRIVTSGYMLDQIFNYIFFDRFEQLDPLHLKIDMEFANKKIANIKECYEISNKIITKIKSILEVIGCILKDCDPAYYGNDYLPDIEYKHSKLLEYEGLPENIYHHHVILRSQDLNNIGANIGKLGNKVKTGDWLIYKKDIVQKKIELIMLAQHPDFILKSLDKCNPIDGSTETDKILQFLQNKEPENYLTLNRTNKLSVCITGATARELLKEKKRYNKTKNLSIQLHKKLITSTVNMILNQDYIITQN